MKTPVTRLSRGGAELGALAGAACVACCALPVLIGAGVLSGGAAVWLAEAMPLITAVLAVAAVAVFALAARRKMRPAGCAGRCGPSSGAGEGAGAKVGTGCGCGSAPAPASRL